MYMCVTGGKRTIMEMGLRKIENGLNIVSVIVLFKLIHKLNNSIYQLHYNHIGLYSSNHVSFYKSFNRFKTLTPRPIRNLFHLVNRQKCVLLLHRET